MDRSKICIYHGNCADGFSAAWAVRKALGEIEFYPGVYNNDPPDVSGKEVYMVDFSYSREILELMVKDAAAVTILDHHVSARDALEGLPGATTVFDMERSGAMITWDYFFPDAPPPMLLRHVQDRDLWKFLLPNTREIQANLFSHPYDFAVWDRLMTKDPQDMVVEGAAIERKHQKDVDELLKIVTRTMVIGGYAVQVANLPYTLASDAAGMLAQGMPFGACYWDTPKGRVFSLRSTKDGQDVSEIAKKYNGGGHKHAAGFRVPYQIAQTFEIMGGE